MGKLERMMDHYFDPPEYKSDEAYEQLEEKIDDLETEVYELKETIKEYQERDEAEKVGYLMSNAKIIGYYCPECESTFVTGKHDGFTVYYKRCPNCGQLLDWGEENE